MPARTTPLITDQYYHLFNRGINKQPIFLGARDYKRALGVMEYCSYSSLKLRFSKFLLLPRKERERLWQESKQQGTRLVEFICFTFMPNHFHFLLKQTEENGISKYMARFQNSYTKYLNTKYKRIGPILQGQCKAVRMEDEEQILHLSRYIHLNAYAGYIVKELDDLTTYTWSSFMEYIGKIRTSICNKEIILSHFKSAEEYKKFVFARGECQRDLEKIKHLILEEKDA